MGCGHSARKRVARGQPSQKLKGVDGETIIPCLHGVVFFSGRLRHYFAPQASFELPASWRCEAFRFGASSWKAMGSWSACSSICSPGGSFGSKLRAFLPRLAARMNSEGHLDISRQPWDGGRVIGLLARKDRITRANAVRRKERSSPGKPRSPTYFVK